MNKIKSMLLVVLVSLSIYQTAKLWFDDSSNHNFFYTIFQQKITKEKTTQEFYLVKPNRMIINFGNEQYTILKNTRMEYENIEQDIEKILQEVLYKGKFIKKEELDYNKLLNKKGIICEYVFDSLTVDDLTDEFDIKETKFSKKVNSFNKIIVLPTKSQAEHLQCFFVNDKEKTVSLVELSENKEELYGQIENIEKAQQIFIYNSTKQSNLEEFQNNIFLPIINDNNPYAYNKIINTNYFAKENQVEEKEIQKFVNYFFENPSAKWSLRKDNGVLIYGDGKKTVKYFPEGLIDYTNEQLNEKTVKTSLSDAYRISRMFLEKDNLYLSKELYLSKIVKEDDAWIFYFDFRIDDFPYIISEELAKKINMTSALKMKVRNGNVIEYKGIIKKFDFVPNQQESLKLSYTKAIDKIKDELKQHEKIDIEKLKITDMYLAYYNATEQQNPTLTWVIEINNKRYFIKAVE